MTLEAFEREIGMQGMRMDELRLRVRDSILRQRILGAMVMRKAEVTPEDIDAYYKENYSRFSTPSSVDFSVIMLGPGRDAGAVYEEITSGKTSFADAARKYSDSPTAALGGSMGDIPWKDLNPTWSSAMEGLKAGETTEPVVSGNTTILLHVNALHEGTAQSLEEVSDQIEGALREIRLAERMEEYNSTLRAKAVIEMKI
jgi:peptidyl-prolyl cis-trans isomerase SurA